MKFKKKTLNELADMICGNFDANVSLFKYRSSSYLTKFFEDCELDNYTHDGSTRSWWVTETLIDILSKPSSIHDFPSPEFIGVIRELMDKTDSQNDDVDRTQALAMLNRSLAREGLEAYYDASGVCQVKNSKTKATSSTIGTPQRAWTREEQKDRESLSKFFDEASEDSLIEEILLLSLDNLDFRKSPQLGIKTKHWNTEKTFG